MSNGAAADGRPIIVWSTDNEARCRRRASTGARPQGRRAVHRSSRSTKCGLVDDEEILELVELRSVAAYPSTSSRADDVTVIRVAAASGAAG